MLIRYFHSTVAKVRLFRHIENSINGAFRIPHSWYLGINRVILTPKQVFIYTFYYFLKEKGWEK